MSYLPNTAPEETPEAIIAKLRADLSVHSTTPYTCDKCGAPMFDTDDGLMGMDATGCWPSIIGERAGSARCYSYRVAAPLEPHPARV
jgi:hypothetical protein